MTPTKARGGGTAVESESCVVAALSRLRLLRDSDPAGFSFRGPTGGQQAQWRQAARAPGPQPALPGRVRPGLLCVRPPASNDPSGGAGTVPGGQAAGSEFIIVRFLID